MRFKEGDMVVFNEEYILKLYERGRNVEFNGIEDVIRHIANGNKPMRLRTVEYTTNFGVIDSFKEYGNYFNINLKEIRHLKRKIRRIK